MTTKNRHKRTADRAMRNGHIQQPCGPAEKPPAATTPPAPVATVAPVPPAPPPMSAEEAERRARDGLLARFTRRDLLRAARMLADGESPDCAMRGTPAEMLWCVLSRDAIGEPGDHGAWPLVVFAEDADGALCEVDHAGQDAARAIVEFIAALRWAEATRDPVRAMVADIRYNHQHWRTAAWPRLAYIIAAYGRAALAPYPGETLSLERLARYELSARPKIVPESVYRMLGIGAPDEALAREAAEDLAEARRKLEIAAARTAELLFAAARDEEATGPESGARDIADRGAATD